MYAYVLHFRITRSLGCEHSMPLWLWGAASTQQPQWPLWVHITYLTCVHTHIHTYVLLYKCMLCVNTASYTPYVHTFIHTYVRTYAHTGHMHVAVFSTLSTPKSPHTSLQELIHVRVVSPSIWHSFSMNIITQEDFQSKHLWSLLTPCSLCGTAYFTACICPL